MKKIRESFHMIAAAVFCIVISIQTRLFPGSGRAMNFDAGDMGYGMGGSNVSGDDITASSMSATKSKINNYIKKVFFWLGGPGDRKVMILSGTPPIITDRLRI